MKARKVNEIITWELDPDTVVLIKDGGEVVWEGECRNIPDEYRRRYVRSIDMRCEVYVRGVPEVEYVTVTLFGE